MKKLLKFFSLVHFCALITCVSCKSYYRLTSSKTPEDNKNAEPSIINKAFFECDRSSTCTHVVLLQNSNYVAINGDEQLATLSNKKEIWEKVIPQKSVSNIAFGKPAALSSLYRNGSSEGTLAVNGILETYYCSKTKLQLHAWLMIDLERKALVKYFKVFSIEPDFRVMEEFNLRFGYNAENGGMGNPACAMNAKINITATSLEVVCPNDMTGRYATLNTVKNDFLEVCELEVYGYFIN